MKNPDISVRVFLCNNVIKTDYLYVLPEVLEGSTQETEILNTV